MKPNDKRNAGSAGAGSNNWLVTFGDLLTLLLCFFLTLVTFQTHGEKQVNAEMNAAQHQNGQAGAESPIDKKLLDLGKIERRHGISLARDTEQQLFARMLLLEKDLEPEDQIIKSETLSELIKLVNIEGYKLEQLTLESCATAADAEIGPAWLLSLQRVLALKGQIVDAGVNELQVRTRVVGPHCGAIRRTEGGSAVVAVHVRSMKQEEVSDHG